MATTRPAPGVTAQARSPIARDAPHLPRPVRLRRARHDLPPGDDGAATGRALRGVPGCREAASGRRISGVIWLLPFLAFIAAGFLFRKRALRPIYLAGVDPDRPEMFDRIVCPHCRKWVRANIVNGEVTTFCQDCGVVVKPLGEEARVTVPNLAHRKEPRA